VNFTQHVGWGVGQKTIEILHKNFQKSKKEGTLPKDNYVPHNDGLVNNGPNIQK
jgi:hypothetical protein